MKASRWCGKTVYVYAVLINDTKQAYVGLSERSNLNKRLNEHLNDAVVGRATNQTKEQAIRDALDRGEKVEIVHLETVDSYFNEEAIWRQKYESAGWAMLNEKEGDDLTTPAEARQLKEDIQEARKQWKKPKKTVEPLNGKADEREVEFLVKLYEDSPEQFEWLRGIHDADPEEHERQLKRLMTTS